MRPCPYVRATFVPRRAADDVEGGQGFWVCRAGSRALALSLEGLRQRGCLRGEHSSCPDYAARVADATLVGLD